MLTKTDQTILAKIVVGAIKQHTVAKTDIRKIILEEIEAYGVTKSEFLGFKEEMSGKLELLTQHTLTKHLDNHTSPSDL